jgi:hypothetical protein
MNRAENLLLKGFFPSQVPPPFSSRSLALQLAVLRVDWGIDAPKAKAPSCKPEIFSVARAGHQRRLTSLINPVPQTFLTAFVARHWADFLRHYRKSQLSASRPRFLPNGDRAACIPSMQRLHEKKILESAGFKYMLRTDVSRFFPTVYTHSVPWALHSKVAAKKNRSITSKYFGNLIDQALRQGQDEQTMGLPIGPDTSHIIAEAIAISVDLLVKSSLKSWPAGFRYVDDYFLFFASVQDAEGALAVLTRALKEFELHINFEKTKICPVQDLVDDYWSHQLRSFELAKEGRRQRSDIHHFFELAKDLAAKNSDENVMTYALKRASSVIVRHENWDVFEARICHAALSHPNTLQTVSQIFATYRHHGYRLNQVRIRRTINALISEHAALGHHSEVAWCLWMCKELEVELEVANVDLVAAMHSSICALLLMDLAASGKLSKAPKETFWRSIDGVGSLREEFWLVCYEAGVRGWGGFTSAKVVGDEYFRRLHELNVSFYDSGAASALLFNVKSGVLEKLNVKSFDEFFELDDVEDYLEYLGGDGGYEGVVFDDEEDGPKNKSSSAWEVDDVSDDTPF